MRHAMLESGWLRLLSNSMTLLRMTLWSWPLTHLIFVIMLYIYMLCEFPPFMSGFKFMAINAFNEWPFATNSPVSLSWGCLGFFPWCAEIPFRPSELLHLSVWSGHEVTVSPKISSLYLNTVSVALCVTGKQHSTAQIKGLLRGWAGD